MNLIDKLVIKHELNKMKNTVSFKNIMAQNEPAIAHLIGTIALICAVVASIPLTLSQAGVTSIPPIIVTISGYAVSIGAVIKLVSKSIGVPNPADNSPVTNQSK